MIKVKVNSKKGINSALKIFKRRVKQTGLFDELKSRKTFTKKSAKRRETMNSAVYREKYLRDNEILHS
tara:strand:- start:4601 stop:4804 length:204 start_codon:yes stop_codon:yes gene_type:complete